MSEEISLFNAGDQPGGHFKQPLADRMRPRNLAEMVGQEHLLAPGKPLRQIIDQHIPIPLILWGATGNREDDSRPRGCQRAPLPL